MVLNLPRLLPHLPLPEPTLSPFLPDQTPPGCKSPQAPWYTESESRGEVSSPPPQAHRLRHDPTAPLAPMSTHCYFPRPLLKRSTIVGRERRAVVRARLQVMFKSEVRAARTLWHGAAVVTAALIVAMRCMHLQLRQLGWELIDT